MRLPIYLLPAVSFATFSGCGGGGSGNLPIPAQSNQVLGPTLGKLQTESTLSTILES
jgi:hypothetical protein